MMDKDAVSIQAQSYSVPVITITEAAIGPLLRAKFAGGSHCMLDNKSMILPFSVQVVLFDHINGCNCEMTTTKILQKKPAAAIDIPSLHLLKRS